MKKKLLFLGTVLLSLLLICGCTDKNSDAYKFKTEYESLNGTESASGKKIREIVIEDDNPMIYKTAEEIVKMIEDKETFLVYFGFAKCPWCRSVLPTLLNVADDLKLDTIYYVDVLEIRDTLELNDKNELITKTKGTDGYYKLLELLNDILDDYNMTDSNGKKIDTHEKRIYAPNVVAVVNGEAKEMVEGVSEKLEDPYGEITEEMKKASIKQLKCIFKCINEANVCTGPSSC